MSYTVLVERQAGKALTRRIHPRAAERNGKANLYPKGSTRLSEAPGYRIKIGGEYRALYFVHGEKQVVSGTGVGTREGFYG